MESNLEPKESRWIWKHSAIVLSDIMLLRQPEGRRRIRQPDSRRGCWLYGISKLYRYRPKRPVKELMMRDPKIPNLPVMLPNQRVVVLLSPSPRTMTSIDYPISQEDDSTRYGGSSYDDILFSYLFDGDNDNWAKPAPTNDASGEQDPSTSTTLLEDLEESSLTDRSLISMSDELDVREVAGCGRRRTLPCNAGEDSSHDDGHPAKRTCVSNEEQAPPQSQTVLDQNENPAVTLCYEQETVASLHDHDAPHTTTCPDVAQATSPTAPSTSLCQSDSNHPNMDTSLTVSDKALSVPVDPSSAINTKVLFGKIKHSPTKMWRDAVKKLSDDYDTYPKKCPNNIVDQVTKVLAEKGVTGFCCRKKCQNPNGTQRWEWAAASAEEIHSKTKERFNEDRKDRSKKRPRVRQPKCHATNNGPSPPNRVVQFPAEASYPITKNIVCFEWNHHPGTVKWHEIVKGFSDNNIAYPKWDTSIFDRVMEVLAVEGLNLFLVFLNSNGEACLTIQDGLWFRASENEIMEKTKQLFLSYRQLDPPQTVTTQGSAKRPPKGGPNGGGPPAPGDSKPNHARMPPKGGPNNGPTSPSNSTNHGSNAHQCYQNHRNQASQPSNDNLAFLSILEGPIDMSESMNNVQSLFATVVIADSDDSVASSDESTAGSSQPLFGTRSQSRLSDCSVPSEMEVSNLVKPCSLLKSTVPRMAQQNASSEMKCFQIEQRPSGLEWTTLGCSSPIVSHVVVKPRVTRTPVSCIAPRQSDFIANEAILLDKASAQYEQASLPVSSTTDGVCFSSVLMDSKHQTLKGRPTGDLQGSKCSQPNSKSKRRDISETDCAQSAIGLSLSSFCGKLSSGSESQADDSSTESYNPFSHLSYSLERFRIGEDPQTAGKAEAAAYVASFYPDLNWTPESTSLGRTETSATSLYTLNEVFAPNPNDVCFQQNGHPATKIWQDVVRRFADDHLTHSEWSDNIVDQVKTCLRQHNIYHFLVCDEHYGGLLNRVFAGTRKMTDKWVTATEQEILEETKFFFLYSRQPLLRRIMAGRSKNRLRKHEFGLDNSKEDRSVGYLAGKMQNQVVDGCFEVTANWITLNSQESLPSECWW